MSDPIRIEKSYSEISKDLMKYLPDGVMPVNIQLLDELGLLADEEFDDSASDHFEQYFHVIEAPEKVTLFNERFAIWIIPKAGDDGASTLTILSILNKNIPEPELAFLADGVFNSPKYILKILQHFITEVIDTEDTISSIDKIS